jgi:phosphohistidine phosphatase
MKIILVRHGETKPLEFPGKDVDRNLTSLGISEIEKLSAALFKTLTEVPLIVCSHALRARKTAEILSNAWNCVPVTDNALYYGGLENYDRVIRSNQTVKNLILVGHNPDISLFASFLCGSNLRFSPGSCAVIIQTTPGDKTKHELLHFIHPERN